MSVVNQLMSPFPPSSVSADAALAAATVNTAAFVSQPDKSKCAVSNSSDEEVAATAAKKTFYCDCCQTNFPTGFNLRRHMRKKHRDEAAASKNENVEENDCCEIPCKQSVVKCVRPMLRQIV